MKEIFLAYPAAAWSIVSVLLAGIAIMLLWEKLKWWWHNTWYSFPVIGKLASLSGDINKSSEPGWFKGERTLCRDYKKFIRIQDEHDFNEKIAYLTKAGDLGRSETPKWIWLLTISMVVVEALGFSYVLAGFTIPGASESTQQYGAIGIAFLLSVILVAFTHLSGHELFVSSKIKQARNEWENDDPEKNRLYTGDIALAKPQNSDDHLPAYTQLCNRVGHTPNYKITLATAIVVTVVAIGATYVRGKVLDEQLLMEKAGRNEQVSLSVNLGNDALDLSVKQNDQLPAADVAEQNKAEQKVDAESNSNKQAGGWGTFIVLAFIFVFLQLLGVIFGYRWDFAGKQSKAAFRAIGNGRYSSYADVREHYQEIADTAQAKLENLQQKMMKKLINKGQTTKSTARTFRDFMEEERQNQTKERADEVAHLKQRRDYQQAPAPAAVPVTPVAEQHPKLDAEPLTVEQAVEQLNAMSDKEAKKDYLLTLPSQLQAPVRDALRQQKEAREAAEKARNNAELDDLLD
ncbi:hypothetical protein HQ393_14585 [Chitinibacter bivalviorum]|uniref:Uncharacterized protein n=1 Tax=Chitinibacter bivalviorum TaxID=2739434 RepID=A0A7H9BLS0_9NEIS|nr:hypothetical protein [Chitinibacter bivalviorum]QLG89372.1 hypothetical protein HQ393_14585 [Chitinibacter bivalviorum]